MKTELLKYEEVAKIIGSPVGTIYALVHHNQIPHIRLGKRFVRFDYNEIQNWIDQNRKNNTLKNKEEQK